MNVAWGDLLAALALLLVIEGVIPFVNPQALRRMLAAMNELDDRSLRIAGLISMIIGLVMLTLTLALSQRQQHRPAGTGMIRPWDGVAEVTGMGDKQMGHPAVVMRVRFR